MLGLSKPWDGGAQAALGVPQHGGLSPCASAPGEQLAPWLSGAQCASVWGSLQWSPLCWVVQRQESSQPKAACSPYLEAHCPSQEGSGYLGHGRSSASGDRGAGSPGLHASSSPCATLAAQGVGYLRAGDGYWLAHVRHPLCPRRPALQPMEQQDCVLLQST